MNLVESERPIQFTCEFKVNLYEFTDEIRMSIHVNLVESDMNVSF